MLRFLEHALEEVLYFSQNQSHIDEDVTKLCLCFNVYKCIFIDLHRPT